MNIVVEVIASIILIIVGYIATISYLNTLHYSEMKRADVKVNSKNRALYLITASIINIILIAVFNTIYIHNTLLHCLKLLVLVGFILPMAAVDFRLQKIPNVFVIGALITRGVILVIEFVVLGSLTFAVLKDSAVGALIIGVFFLLILLVFKNSIGMGDIKLFMVMGLYQGLWGTVNSVFFSLLVSFAISVTLLITKKKGRKDVISFGPSILIGTVLAISLAGI